jgi:hypothetical protein
MKTIAMLVLCLIGAVSLGAQDKSSGPPDQILVYTPPDKIVVLQFEGNTYFDLVRRVRGDDPGFIYHLDVWEPGFIALTGASYNKTDSDGRREVSVITAVRDVNKEGKQGTAHGIQHVILGETDSVQKIALRWDKDSPGGEATDKLGVTIDPEHPSRQ